MFLPVVSVGSYGSIVFDFSASADKSFGFQWASDAPKMYERYRNEDYPWGQCNATKDCNVLLFRNPHVDWSNEFNSHVKHGHNPDSCFIRFCEK